MRARRNVHISELRPLIVLLKFKGILTRFDGTVIPGVADDLLRQFMVKRDQGICAKCGTHCIALRYAVGWFAENRQEGMVTVSEFLCAIGARVRPFRRRLWEIDHIVPIIHGGLRFEPKNLQTLCLACHRDKTALDIQPRRFTSRTQAAQFKS